MKNVGYPSNIVYPMTPRKKAGSNYLEAVRASGSSKGNRKQQGLSLAGR